MISRYYQNKIKRLQEELKSKSDYEEWKQRAIIAEQRADQFDMMSAYNQDASARIGMEAMARLKASKFEYYLCAHCARVTIHENSVCIGCGVRTEINK